METSTLFLIVLVIIIIFFFSSMKLTFSSSNNSNNTTSDYTKSEPASATQKNNTLVDSPTMAVSLANVQNKFYYDNMRFIPNP